MVNFYGIFRLGKEAKSSQINILVSLDCILLVVVITGNSKGVHKNTWIFPMFLEVHSVLLKELKNKPWKLLLFALIFSGFFFFYKGLKRVYHLFFKELMKNCNCVIFSSVSFEAMANSTIQNISLFRRKGVLNSETT